MLSEKISIREAKMKLIFGAWLSDLNGLRLQLCITFLTHLIKIRDSLLSVTSSLPGLMIQVLRSFYSSTHASAQQLTEVYLWQHMSVVTPVSENCYDVSLNFCATQLSQGDLSRLRVMQESALAVPCLLGAWSLTELLSPGLVSVASFLWCSLYRQSPAGPRRAPTQSEHMVTMGNIMMSCIRQQMTSLITCHMAVRTAKRLREYQTYQE